MRISVVFSSTEPVLVVSRQPIRSRPVLDELRRIGCLKFIAREVPIEQVRCLYGRHGHSAPKQHLLLDGRSTTVGTSPDRRKP